MTRKTLTLMLVLVIITILSVGVAVWWGRANAPHVNIDGGVIFMATVSLYELREDSQHKQLSPAEIMLFASILRTARYEKKAEFKDVGRTEYISRYQFVILQRGGTPRSGNIEYGMLTIDGRTLYCGDGIFTLRVEDAQRLIRMLPKPKNPRTISERREANSEKR